MDRSDAEAAYSRMVICLRPPFLYSAEFSHRYIVSHDFLVRTKEISKSSHHHQQLLQAFVEQCERFVNLSEDFFTFSLKMARCGMMFSKFQQELTDLSDLAAPVVFRPLGSVATATGLAALGGSRKFPEDFDHH